eukprot:gnl/TRDRNA2_/TRDRNA2_90353_c0_seq1.p1 gnl/TRDRNA2_/TRDRNA2_90353_c0~~gnl/TRDRNA2_/TRDRNA2_90353_c0_seq1.p1  ORF type:complete len:101 (+),score=1.11 gnl/TRDRNA2_/TRDRNA2_90353_c0_seq1:911-1213(+)
MYYRMIMDCLASTGQITAGFVLLARTEASSSFSDSNETCYPMFRALLEACRLAGDTDGASLVEAALQRLGLSTIEPATSFSRARYIRDGTPKNGFARPIL